MPKFFQVSKKKEDLKQGVSNYINSSNVFPVTILAAIVSESKGGSVSIDMYVDHADQKQVVYGNLRITNNDGSDNEIGRRIFNQLVVIAGLEDLDNPVEDELPIGKQEAMKDVAVLEDLADIDVLMRVQMEYSVYNGKIQEKKVIKGFFRAEDKATAEEIVNESEPGEGYEKESKYFENVTYKNDLTPEIIEKWIAGGRKDDGVPGGSSTAKKAPGFGKKRKFGKKQDSDEE